MADGNFSSAYNARFCNGALYARRAHNSREFFCRCSQQIFREIEPPPAPQKPKAPEPRTSERMSRDTTTRQEQIAQGLAGGINRVGHNNDHPTDKQARTCPKAHEWAKARQTEREKLQKYEVYSIISKVSKGFHPVDTKWVYDVKKDASGNMK